MSVAASLSGFPPVIRTRVRSGCGSEPGRATVECVVGNGVAGPWPALTTLQIGDGSKTLSWADMRVIGSPRVRGGYMRVVLEDSRWKLRNVMLPFDYNQLDSSGVSLTSSQATMATLATTLGGKTALSIVAGTNVPTFTPPAPWRGAVAADALKQLLRDAVCRLHYSPINGQYSIWAKGTGNYPVLGNRLYRPSPNRAIRNIFVRSAPTLYEDRMSATAVVENGAGAIVNLSSHEPDEYFSGFPTASNNPILREKLRQGAFRLWKITATDRNLRNHRALSLLSASGDVKFLGLKMVREDLAGQMCEQPIRLATHLTPRDESGYQLYVCDAPFLQSAGGGLKTTADIIASYHRDGTGGLQRKVQSRAISGVGVDVAFNIEWVRPIESTQNDLPTSQWETYLGAVADALQTALSPNPHTVTLPGLVVTPPSGHIGAVEYYVSEQSGRTVTTRIALDFDANPGDLT